MKKTELKIHTWPDKILKKKCKKVKVVDDSIRQLLDDMHKIMVETKGVGLAANQVGLTLNLAVIEFEDKLFKLVNPCIIKKEGKTVFLEGCLSFPELEIKVKRAKKIWISAYNEKGEPIEIEFDGIFSVVAQHELDHLKGIVFIDRIPLWQRLKILPQLKTIAQKTKHAAIMSK
jgi:peptide deformylase